MSNRLVDNEEVEVGVNSNVGNGGGAGSDYSPPSRLRRDNEDNDVGILTLSDSVTNSSIGGSVVGGDTPMVTGSDGFVGGGGGGGGVGTADLGDGGLEEVSSGYVQRSRFTGPTV